MHPIYATLTEGPRGNPNRVLTVEVLRPSDIQQSFVCLIPGTTETVVAHVHNLKLTWTAPIVQSREAVNPS